MTVKSKAKLSARVKRPGPSPLHFAAGFIVLIAVVFLTNSFMSKRKVENLLIHDAISRARAAVALDSEDSYLEALEILEEILADRPNEPKALGLAAYASIRLFTEFGNKPEHKQKAEDYIRHAESRSVNTPEARIARGIDSVISGRPADAFSQASSGLHEHRGHPGLLWIIAQSQIVLEREDLALESLEKAWKSRPFFLPAHTLLAEMHDKNERYEEAEKIRYSVLEQFPNHTPTLLALVDSTLNRNADPDDTLNRLLATEKNWENFSDHSLCVLHVATAKIAITAGRPDLAAEAENRALDSNPGIQCREELADLLFHRHRLKKNLKLLETGRINNEDLLMRTGIAAILSGMPEWVIERFSTDAAPHFQGMLAYAFFASGEPENALSIVQSAGNIVSHPSPVALGVLSMVAGSMDDKGSSRNAAVDAYRAVPENPALHEAIVVGAALLYAEKNRHAIEVLERALESSPIPCYSLLMYAAKARMISGDNEKALEYIEKAILLNPNIEEAVDLYLDTAPTEQALSFFSKLPDYWANPFRGLAYSRAENYSQASEILSIAQEKGCEYWTSILDAMIRLHRSRMELQDFRELIEKFPERAVPRQIFVDVLLLQGRLAESKDVVSEGLKHNPQNFKLNILIAELIALMADEPGENIKIISEIIHRYSIFPGPDNYHGRLHASLALACAITGENRACALREINNASTRAPRDGRVLFISGMTYELLGDIRNARLSYRSASSRPGGEEGMLRYGLITRNVSGRNSLRTFLRRFPEHISAQQAVDALSGR